MQNRTKILAVCGFGIGTSLILRITIEKVLKDIGIDAEVENVDITTAPSLPADMIFTSQEFCGQLEGKTKAAVIAVYNFLSYDEMKEKTLEAMSHI
jgi:ascorbate PTS system EIIB component